VKIQPAKYFPCVYFPHPSEASEKKDSILSLILLLFFFFPQCMGEGKIKIKYDVTQKDKLVILRCFTSVLPLVFPLEKN